LIGLITDVIWLASALAVLTSVVLFMLNPLYAFWIETKYHIDLEGDLYQAVSEAVEKAADDGSLISIQLNVGEPPVEEASKEEESTK
jgi:hypothetical protein